MIRHDVFQGTRAWALLRAGIPTASEFHKILTPKMKISDQAADYANLLCAEYVLGRPMESFSGKWMERGQEHEQEAVDFYEFTTELKAEPVGFLTNDEGTIGASLDRLVGTDGALEVKCPLPHTHISYLLSKQIDAKYTPQLQGQLLISERAWVDIISYHPELPPVIIRVERDEKYIELLSAALKTFTELLAANNARMEELYGPFERRFEEQIEDIKSHSDFVSDADVDAILQAQRAQREARIS